MVSPMRDASAAAQAAQEQPLATLNLPFYLCSLILNANSCEFLELDGVPDPKLLRQALQAAVGRHPSLNSRIRRRGLRAFWQRSDKDEPIELHWHDLSSADAATLHQHFLHNIWGPGQALDLHQQRAARFHLTVTRDGSVLQLITTHVWSDARAGYRLSHEICQAYSALHAGQAPAESEISVPVRNSEHLLRESLAGREADYRSAALRALAHEINTPATGLSVPPGRGPNDFCKVDLGAEFLTRLRQAARRRGVTVHALITAALVLACRDHDRAQGIHEPRLHQIHDLFSMRKLGHGGEPGCTDDLYDTMVLPFDVNFDTSLSSDALIGEAMAKLEKLKSGGIFIEYFKIALLVKLLSFLPKRWGIPWAVRNFLTGNVMCTNPGPVPYAIDALGDLTVTDFYSFSQLFPPGRIMLVFSTFRDRLRLITVYDELAFPADVRAEFITPLLTHLECIIAEINSNQAAEEVVSAAPGAPHAH